MHNIAEGAASLFSDFPEWNLKVQTMMLQDFGAAEGILNSVRPQSGDLSGDDRDAYDFEITSRQGQRAATAARNGRPARRSPTRRPRAAPSSRAPP